MKQASRLKLARLAKGLNQTELAAKVGKHQVTISEFERGYRLVSGKISMKMAKQISRILEMPLTELFPELSDDSRPSSEKGRKVKEVHLKPEKV